MIGGSNGIIYGEKPDTDSGEDAMIYIQGVRQGAKPLKVEDVYATGTVETPKDGFIPLSSIYSTDGHPANLSEAYDGVERVGKSTRRLKMDPLYVYVRSEEHKDGDYLTGIYITSK